ALAVLAMQQGIQRTLHGTLHAMELMPLGNDLEAAAAIGTAVSDKPTEELEQGVRLQQTANQHLKLKLRLVHLLAFQKPPPRVPGQRCAEGPVARNSTVGNHTQEVEPEQLRDIRLVGLDLVPRGFEVCV